jgi:putative endonuclease
VKGYFYILRCSDGSYYAGSTTNLDARIATHQAGEGGDYTARRLPVEAAYSEEFETLHDAFLVERQVKGWSRAKKEALIRREYDALPPLAANAIKREERRVLRQAQDADAMLSPDGAGGT